MGWWIVWANGRPFGIYTHDLNAATIVAALHLAGYHGGVVDAHITHAARIVED